MRLVEKELSTKYQVRRLEKDDIPTILSLCEKNTMYYEFCPPFVTEESILSDMIGLPPKKTLEDKFYVGFFEEEKLVAVLDLIIDYPEKRTAYIGFFMTDVSVQKRGIGSKIINDLSRYLCYVGFTTIGLCWVQGNPQAEHFWKKNGFIETGRIFDMDDFSVVDARKHMMTTNNIRIEEVTAPEGKQQIARSVLEALPEWFGIPESTEEYIRDSATYPFFAAYCDDMPVGFLALKKTGKDTMELYVMGVRKEYHRSGVGRAIFQCAKEMAKASGYSFLQVKTVEMGHYAEYDATNRFYLALGFKELEVFPTLWDEWNPCQIYVMAL